MPIRFTCPTCGENYTVNDSSAGLVIECKNETCGQWVQVPPAAPAPPAATSPPVIIIERVVERIVERPVRVYRDSAPSTQHTEEYFRRRNFDETASGCVGCLVLIFIALIVFAATR